MSMVNENEQKNPFEKGDTQLNWRVIVGLVVLVLSIIFILQNTEEVNIDFLFFDFKVGMWFGLLLAFVLGAIVGWGLHLAWRRRKKNRAAEKAKNKKK
jgi:uncharacterized integral membrane protein